MEYVFLTFGVEDLPGHRLPDTLSTVAANVDGSAILKGRSHRLSERHSEVQYCLSLSFSTASRLHKDDGWMQLARGATERSSRKMSDASGEERLSTVLSERLDRDALPSSDSGSDRLDMSSSRRTCFEEALGNMASQCSPSNGSSAMIWPHVNLDDLFLISRSPERTISACARVEGAGGEASSSFQ